MSFLSNDGKVETLILDPNPNPGHAVPKSNRIFLIRRLTSSKISWTFIYTTFWVPVIRFNVLKIPISPCWRNAKKSNLDPASGTGSGSVPKYYQFVPTKFCSNPSIPFWDILLTIIYTHTHRHWNRVTSATSFVDGNNKDLYNLLNTLTIHLMCLYITAACTCACSIVITNTILHPYTNT